MQPALRKLLTGLIDYAGLFPPAKLPLPEAVKNYLDYQACPDSWMLGRFVIQASRLGELEEFAGLGAMVVSALGRGGADEASFARGLADDIADIQRCRERLQGRVTVDVLETKPPAGVVLDIAPALEAGLKVFLEVPAGATPNLPPSAGIKIRTGGLEPSAFPSCEALARSLAWAKAVGPFKATAGLHHPLPRHDETVKARMHGFVNLFVAGVLLWAGEADERQAAEILACESPADFYFDADSLGWRGRRTTLEKAEAARHSLMTSFGSCSFDEPRDDLRALGWM